MPLTLKVDEPLFEKELDSFTKKGKSGPAWDVSPVKVEFKVLIDGFDKNSDSDEAEDQVEKALRKALRELKNKYRPIIKKGLKTIEECQEQDEVGDSDTANLPIDIAQDAVEELNNEFKNLFEDELASTIKNEIQDQLLDLDLPCSDKSIRTLGTIQSPEIELVPETWQGGDSEEDEDSVEDWDCSSLLKKRKCFFFGMILANRVGRITLSVRKPIRARKLKALKKYFRHNVSRKTATIRRGILVKTNGTVFSFYFPKSDRASGPATAVLKEIIRSSASAFSGIQCEIKDHFPTELPDNIKDAKALVARLEGLEEAT